MVGTSEKPPVPIEATPEISWRASLTLGAIFSARPSEEITALAAGTLIEDSG